MSVLVLVRFVGLFLTECDPSSIADGTNYGKSSVIVGLSYRWCDDALGSRMIQTKLFYCLFDVSQTYFGVIAHAVGGFKFLCLVLL